jgi:hypothetical protein
MTSRLKYGPGRIRTCDRAEKQMIQLGYNLIKQKCDSGRNYYHLIGNFLN